MVFDKYVKNMEECRYECVRCGHRFSGEQLAMRGRIVCPQCGYRVIKKVRPPIARRKKCV